MHARKAWLTGLSPRENRDIPPLDYDIVFRLKAAHPKLPIVLNGGVATVEAAREHLQKLDGVMMGRAAYQEPWRLLQVDPLLFGEPAPFASPKGPRWRLMPYIERELSRGVRLHSITRHLHGLFHAVPGARAYRRHLATAAVKPGACAEVLAEALALVVDRPRRTGANRRGLSALSGKLSGNWGCPLGEIALLVAAVMVAGVATGILAGLFGIGGGAIIVPVLYEIFRILGVPEEVRMQLCVGTSMAIIIPTTIRSYLTHRAKGMVLNDVMRAWALPAVLGVAAGSVIAYFAPSAVFKVVFMVTVTIIAIKLLFGRDSWKIADDFPGRPAMIGLWLSDRHHLVADGGERRLGLQHDPDALRQAAAQRGRDLLRPRRADHHRRHHRPGVGGLAADGAAAAVLDRLCLAAGRRDHGAGVELHGVLRRAARAPAVEAPVGDRLRPVSAAGLGALRRQPVSSENYGFRASSACRRAPPSFPAG